MGEPADDFPRRHLLKQTALLHSVSLVSGLCATQARAHFSDAEEAFLEELERATYLYFWEQASPQTGLVKDRCNVRVADRGIVASIAATGFRVNRLSA